MRTEKLRGFDRVAFGLSDRRCGKLRSPEAGFAHDPVNGQTLAFENLGVVERPGVSAQSLVPHQLLGGQNGFEPTLCCYISHVLSFVALSRLVSWEVSSE